MGSAPVPVTNAARKGPALPRYSARLRHRSRTCKAGSHFSLATGTGAVTWIVKGLSDRPRQGALSRAGQAAHQDQHCVPGHALSIARHDALVLPWVREDLTEEELEAAYKFESSEVGEGVADPAASWG